MKQNYDVRSSKKEKLPQSTVQLVTLENMFVEKLQDKYGLTERGISKALGSFDSDNDGTLSISELTRAIAILLNGVEAGLIEKLVRCYDIGQDGVIKMPEFNKYLLSRKSTDKNEWITVEHLLSDPDDQMHDNNETDIPSKAFTVINNMKAIMTKRVRDLRLAGKLNSYEYFGLQSFVLAEMVTRKIILKQISKLEQKDESNDNNNISSLATFPTFSR